MRHAALPGAALEQARDGGHEPGVAVGDHEANAGQPALAQPAEECRPGVLALGVDHVAAQEVLAPVAPSPIAVTTPCETTDEPTLQLM